ncbi:protein transport protein Sec16B [Rhinophrynus dorsalis]
MEHGAPPWYSQSRVRPHAGMEHWRGMYPQPMPQHYRNNSYEYYRQPYPRGGQQPWPDLWVDYYSQQAISRPRQGDWGRPASRAEVYDKCDAVAYPPLSRAPVHEENGVWGARQEKDRDGVDRLESFSSVEPCLLSQYRDSGMSSSSYELSQYMHDSNDLWNYKWQEELSEVTPQPTAPLKFALPHVTVCFGARGQLVRVCPNFPDEGQPALVEIHSMEVLLHDTSEQEEMRNFPGPMQREDLHKVDVMNFCQQNVSQCLQSQAPRSRDNALLWQMLLQMCRQNGCMSGSDMAELLLQDCKRDRYQREQVNANLNRLSEEPQLLPDGAQVDLLTGEIPSATDASAQAKEKFTKLLFYGRKKATLDWAMKSQLWGHALFLSSKMDSRTYSCVMGQFTSTLAQNDPLQTLFQLMGGRIPQSAVCCGDKKWGDWRPHLSVILSNQTGDPERNQRAIVTMGDNLVLKGLTEAGHCCYLTAGTSFGQYYMKSDRLVLLGSNHSQTFLKFASIQSIQRTEILEYCQSLGKPKHCIPTFQVYKLLYAARLLDYGLASLALHYCECIASAVLTHSGSMVLISQLIKLAERLRFSDPRILDRPEPEQDQEPEWLIQLRALLRQLQGNTAADRLTPVHCDDQDNIAEVTESFTLNEVTQAQSGENADCEHTTVGEEEHGNQWTPQYPANQPVEIQGPTTFEWDRSQTATNTELPPGYRVYEEPHLQAFRTEGRVTEELSVPTLQISCTDKSAQAEQPTSLSKRIRTVSESSTVSMEEDDEEEGTEEEAPAKESKEIKKASGSGWFGWFWSKPAKETVTPQVEPPKLTNLPPQSETSSIPRAAGDSSSHPPPPPPCCLPPNTQNNPFSRNTGIKDFEELQNNNGTLVTNSNPSLSVSGCQTNQPAGYIPLYNPSQFSSDASRVMNRPSRPPRGRYPVQPR